MDISDLFKSCFEREKLGQRVVDPIKLAIDRRQIKINERKNKRDNLLTVMRNIKVDMSPIVDSLVNGRPRDRGSKRNLDPKFASSTPNVCQKNKPQSQSVVQNNEAVQRRLQRLAQWKAEKEKRKQAAKAKEKPLFKVCHVSDMVPSTNNISTLIKGKSILTAAIKKRQFAPENCKFNPPAGVKPISQFVFKKNLGQNALVGSSIQRFSNDNKTDSITAPSTSRLSKKNQVEKKTPQRTTVAKTIENRKPVSIPTNRLKTGPSPSTSVVLKHNSHTATSTKSPAKSKLGADQKIFQKNVVTTRSKKTANTLSSATSSSSSNISTTSRSKAGPSPSSTGVLKHNSRITSSAKSPSKSRLRADQKNLQKNIVTTRENKTAKTLLSASSSSSSNISTTSSNVIRPNRNETKTKEENAKVKKNTNNNTEIAPVRRKAAASPKKANAKNEITRKTKPGKILVEVNQPEDVKSISNKNEVKCGENDEQVKTMPLSNKKSDAIMKTPPVLNKTEINEAPVYVSPFVTISRGKREALQEFKMRSSMGPDIDKTPNISIKRKSIKASPRDSKVFTAHTSPKAGADYFMTQLNNEIDRINQMCAKWEAYLDDPELPEEATTSINVTVGHSQLLISKKFNQFRQLIIQCKTQQYDEKEITCEDLHGFWDMVYMQVEDLDKRFGNLDRLKENNWEEMLPQKKAPVRKTKNVRGPAKKTTTNSKLRDMIKAARAKKMAGNDGEIHQEDKCPKMVEIGQVEARTPLKEQQVIQLSSTKSTKRQSLRASILKAESLKNRCSTSPGLTMMKLSQSIKQNNGLTPYKSILKPDGCKSTGKKSVVFKDVCSPSLLRQTRLFDAADDFLNSPNEQIPWQEVSKTRARRSLEFETDVEKENTPTYRRIYFVGLDW
ncbi:guanylate kinase-associated protein mars isoform X2 [Anthonomus grandis grandis]|uniref:guanylate kinase-associated protein mars isoform X2 n=1 Tax=Anthonomus grandis grandis TaxID=2921223 RepID=UPI0021657F60|nr:guanylate kinase-associated protein mars isoform X2 [Anthonomus grandis grandis]